MQILRTSRGIELILFHAEAHLFKQSLNEIRHNYQQGLDELPDGVKKWWCQPTPDMDPEDEASLNQELHHGRFQHISLIDALLVLLDSGSDSPKVIPLDMSQADILVILVNDHRLYLAGQHQIGESEMIQDWNDIKPGPMQHALLQIHFLAWMLELLILRLSGDEGSE
ncbi:MAG: hypothetical protein ACFCUX_06470 [Candidatus Methylacidiphilales bacterium]